MWVVVVVLATSEQAGEAPKEVRKSEGTEANADAKRMKPLTGGGRSGVGGVGQEGAQNGENVTPRNTPPKCQNRGGESRQSVLIRAVQSGDQSRQSRKRP